MEPPQGEGWEGQDPFLGEARAPAAHEGTSESSWQTMWHEFPAKLASPATHFPSGAKPVFLFPPRSAST